MRQTKTKGKHDTLWLPVKLCLNLCTLYNLSLMIYLTLDAVKRKERKGKPTEVERVINRFHL